MRPRTRTAENRPARERWPEPSRVSFGAVTRSFVAFLHRMRCSARATLREKAVRVDGTPPGDKISNRHSAEVRLTSGPNVEPRSGCPRGQGTRDGLHEIKHDGFRVHPIQPAGQRLDLAPSLSRGGVTFVCRRRLDQQYERAILSLQDSERRCSILRSTFDNGPEPETTPFVLDALGTPIHSHDLLPRREGSR